VYSVIYNVHLTTNEKTSDLFVMNQTKAQPKMFKIASLNPEVIITKTRHNNCELRN